MLRKFDRTGSDRTGIAKTLLLDLTVGSSHYHRCVKPPLKALSLLCVCVMSSIVSRARSSSLPNFLAWRALGFRTICSGGLGIAPSSSPPASAGIKILESFKEEFEVGSRVVTLETGKIARFANGSVVLGMDETKVLSTVTCAKSKSPGDFLPLTVRYNPLFAISFRFLKLWFWILWSNLYDVCICGIHWWICDLIFPHEKFVI